MANYTYEIEVTDSVAILQENPTRPTPVCENLGNWVVFRFNDDEWHDLADGEAKAVFIWNGKYVIVPMQSTSDMSYQCEIPAIDNATVFYVGAFLGENYESEFYRSTTRVEIPCTLSVRDYAKTPQPSYGKGWADIAVEAANKAQEYSALAKEYADLAKEYADQAMAGGGGDVNLDALDKIYLKIPKTTNRSIVPYITNTGEQKTIPMSTSPYPAYLATRDGSGNLSTNEPTEDLHCANKKYVDDHSGWELITTVSHVTSTFEVWVDNNRVIIFVLVNGSLTWTAMVGPRSSSAPIYSSAFEIDGNLAYINYADGLGKIVTPDGVSLGELTIHVYAL